MEGRRNSHAELKEALDRGVQMDTAHGAASLDRDIAQAALDAGFDNFSISTDLHIRNVRGPVAFFSRYNEQILSFGDAPGQSDPQRDHHSGRALWP